MLSALTQPRRSNLASTIVLFFGLIDIILGLLWALIWGGLGISGSRFSALDCLIVTLSIVMPWLGYVLFGRQPKMLMSLLGLLVACFPAALFAAIMFQIF